MEDFNINCKTKNTDKDFKSIIDAYGFKQLVNKPTCIKDTSAMLIDLIFSTRASYFFYAYSISYMFHLSCFYSYMFPLLTYSFFT